MFVSRDQEHAALDDVLKSELLDRSQNLQKLLAYLCEKRFEGHDDQLKEYTIAVEALGRSPDFDQKRDSIVRVEIHRLRKRLSQYYAGPGQHCPVQIIIPEGKYVPQFVPKQAATNVELNTPAVAPPRMVPWSGARVAIAALVLLAVSALAAGWIARSRTAPSAAAVVEPASVIPAIAGDPVTEIRILAGRTKKFVDYQGNTWEPDQYFDGGTPNLTAHPPIARASDQEIFNGYREGDFRYDIPLPPGSYELRLYFAETLFGEGNPAGGAESTRVFRVEANGTPILALLDVLAEAPGARVAHVRVFKNLQPAEDGKLHLTFRSAKNNEPFVNAIEVRRAPPGRIRPIRLAAQSLPVRDGNGHTWQPDLFVEGGNIVKRTKPAEGTAVPELFRGERFGNFRYAIPVAADGIYKLTLYFHEAWFGPDNNGGGGDGTRLFDVHMNHQPLLVNFDLFKAAGGSQKAYLRTFHGLRPSPQGKLLIQFEPKVNYACINAIEVEDESPVTSSAMRQ